MRLNFGYLRPLLAAALLTFIAGNAHGDITLLVNFSNVSPTAATASAANYVAADSNVDLMSTVVNVTGTGSAAPPAQTVTGSNISADLADMGRSFSQTGGIWGGTPILDSYLAASNTPLTVTVNSIEEFAAGTPVTLVVYGVGDVSNQDGSLVFDYNGVTSAAQTTEADATGGVNGDEYATFNFTKVAGVDTVSFTNNGVTQWRGINGFSLTGTSAVPEPSSVIVLASIAGLGLSRRRRS